MYFCVRDLPLRSHILSEGGGGAGLYSQYPSVRGRQSPEFKASLVYRSEFQDSQDYIEKPVVSENKTNKKPPHSLGLKFFQILLNSILNDTGS